MVNSPDWLENFITLPERLGHDDFIYNLRGGNDATKKSAVLILLNDGSSGPEVLITLRSHELRSHSGQPSFPGGAIESGESAQEAALRESTEEVGISPDTVEVLAQLPELYLPPSNFHVTPILAYWHQPHALGSNFSNEVVRAELISLHDLSNPVNRIMLRHRSGYRGPAFDVAGMRIWGFTGGILDRLIFHTGFEQEWNQEKTVELEP